MTDKDTPEKPRKRLPRYDPVMQEHEETLARRFGNKVASELIDMEECDPKNGGMRR